MNQVLRPVMWLLLWPILTEVGMGQTEIAFRRHLLNADSQFSAAAAMDVDGDGALDIVCGGWWYQSPTWTKHRLREVQQIRGRYDDYSNLPLDVDGDGDLDIVSVNYRSNSLYWCRNPGSQALGQLWEQIVIDEPGPSETGRLVDIDGDGQLDILPNGTKTFSGWYEFGPGQGAQQSNVAWQRHALPEELVGHGIGAGDINGDGRVDIVGPRGWAEAPQDPRAGRWLWHAEFRLARDCGLPILCYDVDADGDTDLVWGRGHDIGLYWTEQRSPGESAFRFEVEADAELVRQQLDSGRWVTHAIDTELAATHTLMLADIDGDGRDDLVTGKRFLGHDGRDPGENDPLSVQWYRFDQARMVWEKQSISRGGTCGIDLDSMCADMDQDGDIDILAPARSGLHWLENLRIDRGPTEDSALEAQVPQYASHQDLSMVWKDGQPRPIASALDHGLRRQHILEGMQLVMGHLPRPEQRVALQPVVKRIEDAGDYTRIFLDYAADAGGGVIDRVPAYLLLPKLSGPWPGSGLPAMLCLHPTHFELGKAQVCGLGGQPSRHYAHELARRGYICLAPDYPGFADYKYDFTASGDDYASGTMKAIWNNVRGIDLLESLPVVDRDRIGAIGHSLGGHNALFTAAFDQRLRCVVSSCGFNAFEDYYAGDLKGWSSPRYMPRIASQYGLSHERMPFDFPEVLAAIAPRPLFVNAPLHDSNFAVAGVRSCQASVEPLYKILGQDQAIQFAYPNAEHDFPDDIRSQVYSWLDAQLKPSSP